MRITVLEVSKWRRERRRSLRGTMGSFDRLGPRLFAKLKPRVSYTQKKEKKREAHDGDEGALS